MQNPRRYVQQIQPHQARSFDQHFWPVMVALCVLCGISFGAILTILRGPWMWTSLLVLPALAALSIYFLYRLDNTRLRRSLQLAIIVSLAVHLLILIYASATFVFQNNYQLPKQQIVKRPSKTIQISNRQTPYVFQQTNQQNVPEPVIEPEKEQPTVQTRPQPIPVKKQTQHPLTPQIVRRETPSKTVPRQGKQLSQLRRQTRNLKPQSSLQSKVNPAAQKQPSKPTASESKVTVAREAASSQAAKSSSPPPASQVSKQKQPPTLANQSRRSRRPDQVKPQKAARRLEPSTQSTARIRRSAPRVPSAKPKRILPVAESKPQQRKQVENRPSRSANSITRRPDTQTVARPRKQNQPTTELSPQSTVARAAQRRRQQANPGISTPQATAIVPKRSTFNAPTPSSTVAIEAPSRAPNSSQPSRQLNAKTLSVSRGENGVAGKGVSRNLDRDVGGTPSPAITASDSASRRRTESQSSTSQMLASTQKSESRRSIAQSRMPSSAYKANTNLSAKISGSKTPSKQSMEASAATVDSSSADHRGEVAVQKGESSVDLGPTKVVADQSARRRSGGGQSEVARLNPESTRRSSSSSNENMPTLAATVTAPAAAPNSAESAASSADDFQPDINATAHTRERGENTITREQSTATEMGDILDQGESQLSEQLADSRARASRDQPLDAGQSEDNEEDEMTGNTSSRLAQAPRVRSATALGDARLDHGERETESEFPGEAMAATVIERAAGAIAGTLTQGPASQLLGAAAVLPVADSGTTAKSAKRASRTSDNSNSDALADADNSARSRANNRIPRAPTNMAPMAVNGSANQPNESQSKNNMEAADVAVDHSTDFKGPGAAIDVIAPEGAAGLDVVRSLELGLPTRPASRTSEQIAMESNTRFRSDRFGASPAVSPDAMMAKDAFRSRQLSNASRGRPSNERAINLGLEFLARNQSPDGSWSLTGFDRGNPMNINQLNCDSAATGLAVLAFQGAGYNHHEFKYARQIEMAIDWLVENQADDGGLFVETGTKSDSSCRLYAHGIAALALTEAFGMTQDPELRQPAQRALDYIANTQDPKRGGWRYYTKLSDRQTDTSVTGWMMMALQSGRLAGLDTDPTSFEGIQDWLKVAADPKKPSEFRYNPYASKSSKVQGSQGRKASPSMSAVGLLMQIYSGWDRDDSRLIAGAQSLVDRQLPSDANILSRDTYYWYYATQVLLHVNGPLWETWENHLHPLLVQSQIQSGDMSGSWDPYSPVPDRWGIHAGRLYVTTMNLLSLEVKNRKLPLYDETLKGDDNQ